MSGKTSHTVIEMEKTCRCNTEDNFICYLKCEISYRRVPVPKRPQPTNAYKQLRWLSATIFFLKDMSVGLCWLWQRHCTKDVDKNIDKLSLTRIQLHKTTVKPVYIQITIKFSKDAKYIEYRIQKRSAEESWNLFIRAWRRPGWQEPWLRTLLDTSTQKGVW